MSKEKIINHALKNDIELICSNVTDINKGRLGAKDVINVDLKIDEVDEFNTYIYRNDKERDSDYNELENLI